jgi:pentatricopeptide repeat protein
VLTGLLLVCTKKHHLSSALELFNELSELVNQPSETAYMSLIRCYSDNGQIDVALSLIGKMKRESVELKLRNYHPILEAAVILRDFDNSILTIKQMIAETLIPRSDHFILMLEAAATSGAFDRRGDVELIDNLLCDSLVDLSDMDHHGLMRILSAVENISMEDAEAEGKLTPFSPTLVVEEEEEEEEEMRRTPLRLVQIRKTDSSCPNCNGQLRPLCLNAFDREMVRQGLLNMTTSQFASHHTRNMRVR